MVLVLGTILGGLPVVAEVSFGIDDCPCTGRDYWASVDAIYWQTRKTSFSNLAHGKEIPQHLLDKAEEYDYGFSDLIEQANDYLALRSRPDADDNDERRMLKLT